MLERVCSNVEPAAHFFLRNIERPIRSSHLLDRYFFRNEGENLDSSSWWTAYLESIRTIPHSSSNAKRFHILNAGSPVTIRGGGIVTPSQRSAARIHRSKASSTEQTRGLRAFGRFTSPRQQAKVALNIEQPSDAERQEHNDKAPSQKHASSSMSMNPWPTTSTSDNTSMNIKSTTSRSPDASPKYSPTLTAAEVEYEAIWKSFVGLEHKHIKATEVFDILATSDNKTDWDRAIKAFNAIPHQDRKEQKYRKAMDLLLKLLRHREAITLVLEGSKHGYNLNSQAMAYFVKNLLWSRAAELWRGVDGVSSGFDDLRGMIDLPSKAVHLGQRLVSRDPVYAMQHEVLTELYRKLASIVVESSIIMRSITGKGLMSVITVGEQLCITGLREIALQVLRDMSEDVRINGANSQLALLLFRNWQYTCPNEVIPGKSFRNLAKVCTVARESTDIYDFILDESRKMHGKPSMGEYECIIMACSKQGEAEAMHRFFDDCVRDHGNALPLRFINTLIYVYAKTGDVAKAKEQFDRIASDFNQEPDTVSWNTLLLAHIRSSKPMKAFDVYEEMKNHNVEPNQRTFGMLLNLLGQHADMDVASRFLFEAEKCGVPLNHVMFQTIAESYLANGDSNSAQRMIEQGTTLLSQEDAIRGWNALLRHHAHRGDSEAILRVQGRMKELGVRPDSMTYAALMTALVLIGKTHDAAQILRDLHLGQNMYANEMHYSILLKGFVEEGKRNEATTVYHEMRQRFPQISRSAELTYLKMLCDRDAEAIKPGKTKFPYLVSPREHAIDHLRGLVNNITRGDFASSMPQPGLGRRSQIRESVAQYYEVVLESMLDDGLYGEAQSLYQEFETFAASEIRDFGSYVHPTLRLLTLKMEIEVHQESWEKVADLWNRIWIAAWKHFRPLEHTKDSSRDQKDRTTPPRMHSNTESTSRDPSILDLPNTPLSFDSMIQSQARILHQHRFNLARPLTIYLEALHTMKKYQEMIELVEQTFSGSGFVLNSHNWNTYVQLLSRAYGQKYRLRAFHTFEQKMFRYLSSWESLRRGRYQGQDRKSGTNSDASTVVDRRSQSRLHPELPIPTYYTVTFLGAALARAYRSAKEDGQSAELDAIQSTAPNTVRFLQATPHIKDRIQGALIRGRKITGEYDRRARSESSYRAQRIFPGGVLGSKSPYDNAPPEYAREVEEALGPENQVRELLRGNVRQQKRKARKIDERDLELAEKLTGPVNRSALVLAARARFETPTEQNQRVTNEIDHKANLVRVIRRDAKRKHFFSDRYGGVPVYFTKPSVFRTLGISRKTNTAYNLKPADQVSVPRANSVTPPDSPHTMVSGTDLNQLTQRIVPRLTTDDKTAVRRFVPSSQRKAFSRNKELRTAEKSADLAARKVQGKSGNDGAK